MRIALVLDRFDPDRGGLEQWAWQWTAWLRDHGHEVHVVAAEARKDLAGDGLVLHAIGGEATRFAFAARVAEALPRIDADVVHDLGVGWRCDLLQPQFGTRLADDRQAVASLPFGRRLGAMLSRNRRRRLNDIRRLERRQYAAGGPHVVAVSAMTRGHIVREHGLPDERVTVIHNGVDVGRFTPASASAREAARRGFGIDAAMVPLFVGHNFRLKGLDTVLRAVAGLRRRGVGGRAVHLLVAGRGPVAAFERRARRLGVADAVTFAGFVPDVRIAYAAADVFVQPTFYDPCSLAVLEAAASGLPPLTSRFNGGGELFRHGESAWVVDDPADADATARGIEAWLDPATRARTAARAVAVAAAASHERCFSRLFDLCRQRRRTGRGGSCAA